MFCQVFQHAQNPLGAAFTDGFHVAALLQQLTAHVQRQVSRIHHAFDKSQVGGQQSFGVVHDEDALHIQLHTGRLLAVVQIHRRLAGDVQQLGVFGAAFHAVVRVGQGCFEVVANLFVEIVVLFLADVLFGARPDGVGLVDGFPFAGLDHGTRLTATILVRRVDQFAVFPLFLFHLDGQADVVGVFVDDALDLPGLGIVHCVFAQVQDDAGAACRAGNGFDFKIAGAAAGPAHALGLLHARTAGFDGDLVGHDEAGVKAHAKLADEVGVRFLVAAELGDKVLGAALGNGAQVVNGFLGAHADAVVGDGERFGVFVQGDFDLQLGIGLVQAAVVDGLKAQFVAGVRGIGDQLTQKNFFVGVQRVRHQMQQLGNFGLERKGLLGHSRKMVLPGQKGEAAKA